MYLFFSNHLTFEPFPKNKFTELSGQLFLEKPTTSTEIYRKNTTLQISNLFFLCQDYQISV